MFGPLAWVAKGTLRGKPLHVALVRSWLQGLRVAEDADSPPYGELIDAPKALLDGDDLGAIEEAVWADEEDSNPD